MAAKHGRDTVIIIDGHDISPYCKTSELEASADTHDITGYGKDSYVFSGGLLTSKMSLGGWYDDTSSGPKAVLEPLLGTTVTLVRRPEGTGSGLPQESVSVVVGKYVETNPYNDIIAWSCDLQGSDDITRTTQA
jgi:hypothetical protein